MKKCYLVENENFQKNLGNHENHHIYPNLPGTAQLTLLEQMNSRLAPWFSFSLNLMAKIQMSETIMNELINSRKKTHEIINRSIFSGIQLAARCNRMATSGKPSTEFPLE